MQKIIIFLFLIISANVYSQDSSKYFFDEAYKSMSQGKYLIALNNYEKAISLNPENSDFWLEYTSCLRKAKRYQKAIQAGLHALELEPESALVWNNIGNIYVDCHVWDKAFEAFSNYEKYQTNINKSVQNYLNLGYYGTLNKEFNISEKSLKRAKELQSDNAMAYIDLGVLYASNGDVEKGKEEINKGLEYSQKSNNEKATKYGEVILKQIGKNGTLKFDPPLGKSFQIIPERLLVQSGIKALDLKIDSIVERLIFVTPIYKLKINTPEFWLEETDEQNQVFTIKLQNYNGDLLLISPLTQNIGMLRKEDVEIQTKELGDGLLKDAVESEYLIKKIEEKNYGNFFTLTDKSFKEGSSGYKYISSGYLLVDKLPVIFSILSNNKDDKYLSEYLDVLGDILLIK